MIAMTAQGKRETREELAAQRYVLDILSGMIPTDPLFEKICETAAKHGGIEFGHPLSNIDAIAMAAEIKSIRASALTRSRQS